MINEIKQDANTRMDKSIESFKVALQKIRTGRAHPSLLAHLTVSYYGVDTPLSQAANVSVQDARTLTVQPFEKSMIQPIEKAIMESDIGITPNTAGNLIRLPLPALTEERRKDLIKVVGNEAESAKIAIRNIRRDANSTLKELEKEKEISEDEERRAEDEIQKLTDSHVKKVDELVAEKEKELMEI
ncbi:ribosome recycling factor [Aliikangiella coralliicola]|uniref:Ribosome-recycling factor n=1 Tax=Aliikangiella coralliicola TaxID=2592383 RepID=A0A545UAZ5_9GAMM|nr:ribosome recycling factor [Aliikangiella coralliicola]TQV86642.1 ribosome recycling factor [Aliikangiella coralliicola]